MSAAPPASRPPRDAATVVLLRERSAADGSYDVYLVRRPQRAGFMPDAHVFPGGKVDASDADSRLGCEPALAAAVREAFEECGVLLAQLPDGQPAVAPSPEAHAQREALQAGRTTLADALDALGLRIDGSRIRPWAHWVTPSGEPVRFSARFFVAQVPPAQLATHAPGELIDDLWSTPAEALEREWAGTLKLPPPTYFTLYELARLPALADVERAAAGRRVVTVMPKFLEKDGATMIFLPWDREYAVTPGEGLAMPADFAAPPWSRHVLAAGKWWRR